LPIIAAAVLVGAVILYATSRDLLRPLVARDWRQTPAAGAAATPDPLPVPSPAEIAMDRARELQRGGHLKASLAVLDGVPDADPLSAEAVRLRGELQRTLLESAEARTDGSAAPPPLTGPTRAEVRR
jgi:hypothetical protein